MASLVENIRVSRFVIDGFPAAEARVEFCGSEGGAACPLLTRLSELGTAMPFCLTGRVCGDPRMDDCCDVAGESWGFSVAMGSLGTLTVAMRNGRGRGGSADRELMYADKRPPKRSGATPVCWTNVALQNCRWRCDCRGVGGGDFGASGGEGGARDVRRVGGLLEGRRRAQLM